ncbi:MAG: hypothetical protein IJ916_05600 [Paludibacteraceae bacterium]|nr:hypothetical protein [Paludibacteraceae bacterium]
MKKVFLSILFLFAIILSAVACYPPESLRKIAKVGGIYYGYDDGWFVAGFENDQDSVVLKSKVVIEGKTVTVKNIYIVPFHYKTLHAQNGENTSPRVLVISDGFITIASLHAKNLEKLYISKTVERTHDVCTSEYAAIYSEKLEAIIVNSKNKNLKSVDGILFSKDGANLLKYPAKKAGKEYSIPDNVESICYGAFGHCELETVYYPKQKKGIENYEQFGVYDTSDKAAESMGFELGKTKFIGR